jgi:hypothetical protein
VKTKRKKNRGQSRGVGQPHFDREQSHNPYLKAAILEVVENHLREGDPPETRQTLERLMAAGHSESQAKEMIGSAVVGEIWAMLYEGKPFDRERFVGLLEGLS